MGKKNTKKNNKKKNADKKKKKNMIEGESSTAGEKAVSSERNSTQEPEAAKLRDKRADTSEEEKEEGVDDDFDRERVNEEESWINQDPSESKPLSPLLFIAKLGSDSNQLVLRHCSGRMNHALSLTEKYKGIPYIRVLARDPQKREHQLRFSRYDDVRKGAFILHHEWAKIVAENGLKEGEIVIGRGNFIGHQFRVVLSFTHDSNVGVDGVDGISRERNQETESDSEPEPESERMFFLFEKELDRADLKRVLVISCCSERLKMALKQRKKPYIRVFAEGDEKEDLQELRFSRHAADHGEGTYILHRGWENMVAQHGLEEGDLVTGLGTVFGHEFLMLIRVFKKGETGIPILSQVQILLFQKKLESTDTSDRLVIEVESCKDVVKKIVARAEEVAGADSGGYVRVFTSDERDREYELRLSRDILEGSYVLDHEWKDVVAANGLMSGDTVSCWGGLAKDDSIEMTFDVVKALENVGLERH